MFASQSPFSFTLFEGSESVNTYKWLATSGCTCTLYMCIVHAYVTGCFLHMSCSVIPTVYSKFLYSKIFDQKHFEENIFVV